MSSHFFPCRPGILERLVHLGTEGRFGQPLLFVGPEGSGKEATALEFARLLNCVAPLSCRPGAPCQSCAKAVTFQHPDIRWIGPAPAGFDEEDTLRLFAQKQARPFWNPPYASSSFVSIGEVENPGPMTVRYLLRFLQRRAFQGRVKAVIVANSQRMNAAAANAFLKTLEEPPEQTAIILLATGTEGLLPTILSRCQQIGFNPWPESELAELLVRIAGCDPRSAGQAALIAGGNARKAWGLLDELSPLLRGLAWRIFVWIQEGDRGRAGITADELHRGAPSHVFDADQVRAFKTHGKRPAGQAAGDEAPGQQDVRADDGVSTQATVRRDVAIQLCEWLNLIYSEAVKAREQAQDWRPLMPETAAFLGPWAARRRTETLLRDIARIEGARGDIDHNLNIGLVMAVLFEGLIDNAQKDQARLRAATIQ